MSALPTTVPESFSRITPVPPAPHSVRKAPPRQPLLWASLAYAAGILLGSQISRPATTWLAAILVLIVSAAYLADRRTRIAFTLALASIACLGALAIQLRTTASPPDTRILNLADGRELLITAHVLHEGELLPGSSGELRERIDLETEEITAGAHTLPIQAGLRLGIYQKISKTNAEPIEPPLHLFRYGERLRFPTKLRPPRNFRNPGAFDYQGYLADNGISVLGSVKAENIEPLLRFCRQFARIRAQSHSPQHPQPDPRSLAASGSRSHRCGGPR